MPEGNDCFFSQVDLTQLVSLCPDFLLLEHKRQGFRVESLTPGVDVIKSGKQKVLYDLNVAFLCDLLDDQSIGSNDHERWPVVQLEVVPNIETTVIDASMLDVILADGLPQHEESFLVVKLGTMDPYECYLREVSELMFEIFQFCNDMNAVDAARGPKVDHDEFVLQVMVQS